MLESCLTLLMNYNIALFNLKKMPSPGHVSYLMLKWSVMLKQREHQPDETSDRQQGLFFQKRNKHTEFLKF